MLAMLFTEPIFLFTFLPTLLLIYFLGPRPLRNPILLAFSLGFYAWGEPVAILVMLCVIAGTYGYGLWIDNAVSPRWRKTALWAGVTGNVLVLVIFKYVGFLIEVISQMLGMVAVGPLPEVDISLPIGISFYTFQAVSYLFDVYRREVPAQRNPLHLALYVALFPQLIAGPIVRYSTIADELTSRSVTVHGFASGVERFLLGLGKKLLVADALGGLADYVYGLPSSELTAGVAWIGALSYAAQIYFDFSGYSDMAIGLGRMFGFHFNENFNYPYVSQSVTEFWRRWHISLSTWFRDYLYIPLGGSRGSAWMTYRNLLLVFIVCGLWHGAALTFVAWGLYHGAFLVLERLGLKALLDRCPAAVRWVYTFGVVLVGWVVFRAETFAQAAAMIGALGHVPSLLQIPIELHARFDLSVYLAIVLAVLGSMPVASWYPKWLDAKPKTVAPLWVGVRLAGLALLVVWLEVLAATSAQSPFIYFRF